jgi:hypothetical protein
MPNQLTDQTLLQPCGTTAAYARHRRRREAPCQHCRTAWNAYNNMLKVRKRAASRMPAHQMAIAAVAYRNLATRRIPLPNGTSFAMGALAGTAVAHGFIGDSHTGTQCLACFGWLDDPRHTHRYHRLWLVR